MQNKMIQVELFTWFCVVFFIVWLYTAYNIYIWLIWYQFLNFVNEKQYFAQWGEHDKYIAKYIKNQNYFQIMFLGLSSI